ncbi:PadR family transcriptional regulator [Lacticaseibacillus zhaodongensis]|uniref:PadR family transcriptional regulator n=1 Tax=Lacticaseibacillus zhaodongensis TaxID=2668065 RepID=UPI0012D3110E|nr:PadR family transcriptional regulator [Lacticaseibacillus zhaodongensis]
MAKRNILQFIILGLLNQQARTGYELTKAFDSDIGEFWSAQHSQIYPQLQRLEADGQIIHSDEVSGEKLNRKRYAVTSAGQAALNDWLAADTEPTIGGRDEFALKLYFIKSPSDPRLQRMLAEQQAFHTQKCAHLQAQMAAKFPERQHADDFGHYLVLDHAIRRETAYVQWLQSASEQLA